MKMNNFLIHREKRENEDEELPEAKKCLKVSS